MRLGTNREKELEHIALETGNVMIEELLDEVRALRADKEELLEIIEDLRTR